MSNATAVWSGDLELVASRREQTAALRKQGKVTHDGKRRKTERRAAHGVPIRGWLKAELATEWQCNDYPLRLTPDAVRQWDQHMAQCVRLARLADWHHVADQELAEWDHDRRLVAQQKPGLADCFVLEVRGDADELLRRAMRIRRKAEEYCKALQYGRELHQHGRDVRNDEHPLGWAKHSRKQLSAALDELFARRWLPLSNDCGELKNALRKLAHKVNLPTNDAEGFSLLADRASDVVPMFQKLTTAIRHFEAARVDAPVWDVVTPELQPVEGEANSTLGTLRAMCCDSNCELNPTNTSLLATADDFAAEQVVVQLAKFEYSEIHHVQVTWNNSWPRVPYFAKESNRQFASNGTPGRTPTMTDVARFAEEQRGLKPQPTWKEVAARWKNEHPDETRKITDEIVRCAHKRQYKRRPNTARTQPVGPESQDIPRETGRN